MKSSTGMSSSVLPTFAEEWQSIAFAAALVQRMAPNYQLFSEITGSGNPAVFGNIVNLVWEFVSGKNQRVDFEKQLEKLEQITPDPAVFDMYGVWPALDATVALSSLLSCCERWDESEVQSIVELSKATISGYLEAVDEAGADEPHPLEMAEAECMAELQAIIARCASDRGTLVKRLKEYLGRQAVSNIGLSASGEE